MLNVVMLSVVAPLRSAKNAKRTRKPQQTLVLCRTGLVFSEKINFDRNSTKFKSGEFIKSVLAHNL
jgi:hypothetical protein